MEQKYSSNEIVKYDPSFAKEVYALENGSYIKQCMQCGMCAVSCASYHLMDYSPRRLFNLIKAGKREEVLRSNTMWLCTSCCTCKVRCPRGIPLIDVMHDLKSLAIRLKYTRYPQAAFYQSFWQEVTGRGRVFEGGVMARYYLKRGFGEMQKALGMKDVGINMLRHNRLPLLPPRKIKGLRDLRRIIERAKAMQQEVK